METNCRLVLETCPKAVGSEAYVHLVTFAAYDAVNEGCIFASWNVYGVSDTVEKKNMSSFGLRTNLTAFVSTLYHSRFYSSNGHVGGRRDPGRDAFTREAARVGFLRKMR